MNNSKSLLVLSTAISLVVALGFSGNLKAETIWLEQEDFKTVAQGDKDDQPTNLADGKETTTQTLQSPTEEGGFLLPTYILPEAQGDVPKNVVAVDSQNPWRKPQTQSDVSIKRSTRSTVTSTLDLPQTSNGEKALLENIEKQYQNTAALLENTEKRLAALEKDIENYSKNNTKVRNTRTNVIEVEKEDEDEYEYVCEDSEVKNDSKPRSPLLLPLAPVRAVAASKEEEDEEVVVDLTNTAEAKKDYVDFILEAIERSKARKFNPSQSDEMILRSIPKEMKVSFLPGSADLSNQAFKWLKVFSYNPQRTVGSAVEIRLSPRDLDLQSRRFALMKGALLANGLTPRQIRFVFTDRDCDSVVLRDIQLPEDQEFLYQAGKNGKISQQIIQKW
ncbi:MAG: hypothetical protein J6Y03_04330 [Alphaproteobacteria bacterium]|nr:hypothetical protein [Alphaproteobacteria bacterium]